MSADPLEDIRRRIKDIEDAIWPPGPPGQPTIFDKKIKEIENKLRDLEGQFVTKDIVEDLIDAVKMLAVQRRRRGGGGYMTLEM
ncbi:hypothetical protein [Vannielia sp. SX4]|uniref:hypothetical protein n=1 Tax=Vannielia sp. SX4 TaxID=3463852 RepID=UPI004059931A